MQCFSLQVKNSIVVIATRKYKTPMTQ